MTTYWLDLGAGIDAEHWQGVEAPHGVVRIALDPLLTTSMVASGRLAALPPGVVRVGAEIRPEHSVESGKARSFLPFREGSISHVHCGFMLHLYLETLEILAAEAWRILRPCGTLEVLVPHFGDDHSDAILRRTHEELKRWFDDVIVSRHAGPFISFWADLYRDRTYTLTCRKGPGEDQIEI